MITYDEDWIVALIFRFNGSLALRSCFYAVPSASAAYALVMLDEWYPGFRSDQGMMEAQGSRVWSASMGCLMLLLSFRTKQALDRFWEGTSLLHQMRGEWYDSVSCCIAFSSTAVQDKPKEASMFRHTLVRLMSLCHGSALEEIKGQEHETDMIETIDVQGLDPTTLEILVECKDHYNFNRVELLVHMMQILITNAHEQGVLAVAPPILSRVYQTISRGFVNQLNAKKISDTRFPFPYAQTIAFLLLLSVALTPLLVSTIFTSCPWGGPWAALFTFVPVFGSFSLNFIASELEDPFGNDANDLPLAHFQSEMNNSLLMLLYCKPDHIATVSPSCVVDFTSLKRTGSLQIEAPKPGFQRQPSQGKLTGATVRQRQVPYNKERRGSNASTSTVTGLVSLRNLVGGPRDDDCVSQTSERFRPPLRRSATGQSSAVSFASNDDVIDPQVPETSVGSPEVVASRTPSRANSEAGEGSRSPKAEKDDGSEGVPQSSLRSFGSSADRTQQAIPEGSTLDILDPRACSKESAPQILLQPTLRAMLPLSPEVRVDKVHEDVRPQTCSKELMSRDASPSNPRSGSAELPSEARIRCGNGSEIYRMSECAGLAESVDKLAGMLQETRMSEYGVLAESVDKLSRMLQDWGTQLQVQHDHMNSRGAAPRILPKPVSGPLEFDPCPVWSLD